MIQEAEVKCVVRTGSKRGELLASGHSGRAAWRSPYREKFEKPKRNKVLKNPQDLGGLQRRRGGQSASGRRNSFSK